MVSHCRSRLSRSFPQPGVLPFRGACRPVQPRERRAVLCPGPTPRIVSTWGSGGDEERGFSEEIDEIGHLLVHGNRGIMTVITPAALSHPNPNGQRVRSAL